MFRRFIRPHFKNSNILCMFLIMPQSNKSGVASSWWVPPKIWDVCGNTFFTCWRSVSYWNSIEMSLKIQNEMPPPLSVWIGLNCIFSLWDTSEVDSKGKKNGKWLGIPLNWSLKIQNGMPPPRWVWIGLNYNFRVWDSSEVDFKGGKDWTMTFQVSQLTFSM